MLFYCTRATQRSKSASVLCFNKSYTTPFSLALMSSVTCQSQHCQIFVLFPYLDIASSCTISLAMCAPDCNDGAIKTRHAFTYVRTHNSTRDAMLTHASPFCSALLDLSICFRDAPSPRMTSKRLNNTFPMPAFPPSCLLASFQVGHAVSIIRTKLLHADVTHVIKARLAWARS